MENMSQRIDRGDIKLERAEAIKVSTVVPKKKGISQTDLTCCKAMCDIAADRAVKLQQP